MKENTNKAIVVNSIVLYIKFGITTITSLLSTRFALEALGVDDFGLFSVVGGVISFIAIFNTIMLSTTNRFIATAIGQGNQQKINQTFNVNLVVHIVIAVCTLIFAYPIGDWYIDKFISYSGNLESVKLVYHVTIIGSVISFIGVPFNGLLVAKERFIVFSAIDIISQVIKVIGAYSLLFVANRLLFYSSIQAIMSALPAIIYIGYCNLKFHDICKWQFVRSWAEYKEVLSFSVWVGYGAIAYVGKAQGAALIINNFFNTAMNAALGVANSINNMIMTFSSTIGKSISPQIVKSYASGDLQRSESLVILSSKITFIILLITSSPFIFEPDYLFKIWLGSSPDFAATFVRLLVFDALISALNAGIPDLIMATGKIKWYQLTVNTLSLLSIVVGYFVLSAGVPAYYLHVVFIIFSIIIMVVRQVVLNRIVNFENKQLILKSYIPCIIVFAVSMMFFIVTPYFHPLTSIMAGIIYIVIVAFIFGLNTKEKIFVLGKLSTLLKKHR